MEIFGMGINLGLSKTACLNFGWTKLKTILSVMLKIGQNYAGRAGKFRGYGSTNWKEILTKQCGKSYYF